MNDATKKYVEQYGGSAWIAQQKTLDTIRKRKEFSSGINNFCSLFQKHGDTDIHFLIDGSASMEHGPSNTAACTPLNEALTVAYTLTRGMQESRTGAVATTTLYGNNSKTPMQFFLEDSRAEKVQGFFNAIGRGLQSGSELDNEIDALSDMMADIAPDRKQEIVILTDGDMFTFEKTAEKLAIVKELHPNANISIYTLSASPVTQAGKLAKALAAHGVESDYQTQMSVQDVMDALTAKISGIPAPDRKLNEVLNAVADVRTSFTDLAKKMEKLDDKIAAYEGKASKTWESPAGARFGSLSYKKY